MRYHLPKLNDRSLIGLTICGAFYLSPQVVHVAVAETQAAVEQPVATVVPQPNSSAGMPAPTPAPAPAAAVTPAAPSRSAPSNNPAPGPESFARQPQTPLELWDAIDYLVRVGQPDRAAPYLAAFVNAKPDDATLLEIRDRYGAGSILRLADSPATRSQARPLLEMMGAASHRLATEPERIRRSIEALTKTRIEQDLGVERLRQAGPYAIPLLVEALSQPSLTPDQRALIVGNMGRLDAAALPALVSVLDCADGNLAANAASALGGIGDSRAIPFLTFYAAKPDVVAPERSAARLAIQRITGHSFDEQSQTPSRLLTDEARKYLNHVVSFPTDQVEIWVWDGHTPVPKQMARSDAEGMLGLRFAREALQLAPTDQGAQVVLLSLSLTKSIARLGLDAFPASDPDGAFASALAAGPVVLSKLMRTALADGQFDLATVGIQALARVTNRDALTASGRPSPLIEALTVPDRRVQLAAAEALVALQPQKPFPGSSRVVPVLARFVTSRTVPRAVVIDVNVARGNQLNAQLKALGYDPVLVTSGDGGFSVAADSADVELVIVEPSLFHGSWRLLDTLTNFQADARTAGIPIFIIGSLDSHENLLAYQAMFPRVAFLLTPATPQILKRQLDRHLARIGAGPVTPEERQKYAQRAAAALAQIMARPGSPFETDLTIAEPALTIAINTPATGLIASTALGDMPAVDAQRVLADIVLDPSKPAELRLSTGAQLARSIQRFGPLVSAVQERRLADAFDQAKEPALRRVLAEVVGALRPKPEWIGTRLESLETSPLPLPPPLPAADQNAAPLTPSEPVAAPVPDLSATAPAPGAVPAPTPGANP